VEAHGSQFGPARIRKNECNGLDLNPSPVSVSWQLTETRFRICRGEAKDSAPERPNVMEWDGHEIRRGNGVE